MAYEVVRDENLHLLGETDSYKLEFGLGYYAVTMVAHRSREASWGAWWAGFIGS